MKPTSSRSSEDQFNIEINNLLKAILGDPDVDDDRAESFRCIGVENVLCKLRTGAELALDDFFIGKTSKIGEDIANAFIKTTTEYSSKYSHSKMIEYLAQNLTRKKTHLIYGEIATRLWARLPVADVASTSQIIDVPAAIFTEVRDNSNQAATELNQWFKELLKQAARGLGDMASGHINLSAGSDENNVTVEIFSDSLALKYTIFSSLRKCQPNDKKTFFLNPNINPLVIKFDRRNLQVARRELHDLQFVSQWLERNGYTVKAGQKLCHAVFDENEAARQRDDANVRQNFMVSMEVVDAMMASIDVMGLLLSIRVETKSDALMFLLEKYYKELEFIAHNGNAKTFITATRSRGLTHVTNISMQQITQLHAHLERLEVASEITGVSCAELGDEAMVCEIFKGQRGTQYHLFKKALSERRIGVAALPELLPRNEGHAGAAGSSSGAAAPFLSKRLVSDSGEPAGYSEIDFEKELEQELNKNAVLGPDAFRLLANARDNPINQSIAACLVGSQHSQRAFHLVKENEERQTNTSLWAKVPSRMVLYFVAVADFLENRNVINLTPLRDRLGEIRKYLEFHTPYYLVKNATSNIAEILADPNTTPSVVKGIIESLGGDPKSYEVDGGTNYNRYKLQFDLLAMVIACFMKYDILMPCADLQSSKHPWAFNPHDKMHHGDTNKSWQTSMSWRMNEVHRCSWNEGGAEHYQQRSHRETYHTTSTDLAAVFKRPKNQGTTRTNRVDEASSSRGTDTWMGA